MRSAVLRGTHYQTTQAYERGRTLEFSNKPALRMSGCYNQCILNCILLIIKYLFT